MLAALFAFGGRIADIAGHRRMVLVGIVVFACASALCGATPTGSGAEPWIIVFRVIQGAGAAIMFPAALAIVVAAYPINERGKALAIFFGITGGLTAVGPIAGGYLSEWTWRAIFWVNRPAPLDLRGAVLIAAGMGLAVLGLQQSSTWGCDDPATWGTIVAGLLLLAVFVKVELSTAAPLLRLRIFADRAFAVDNVVLFLLRPAVVAGCAIAAVGYFLWARQLPTSTSTASGAGSSSPARAPASCSARRAPTRSIARRRLATARSPGSRRRSATSAGAWGSRSSARSSCCRTRAISRTR